MDKKQIKNVLSVFFFLASLIFFSAAIIECFMLSYIWLIYNLCGVEFDSEMLTAYKELWSILPLQIACNFTLTLVYLSVGRIVRRGVLEGSNG